MHKYTVYLLYEYLVGSIFHGRLSASFFKQARPSFERDRHAGSERRCTIVLGLATIAILLLVLLPLVVFLVANALGEEEEVVGIWTECRLDAGGSKFSVVSADNTLIFEEGNNCVIKKPGRVCIITHLKA